MALGKRKGWKKVRHTIWTVTSTGIPLKAFLFSKQLLWLIISRVIGVDKTKVELLGLKTIGSGACTGNHPQYIALL